MTYAKYGNVAYKYNNPSRLYGLGTDSVASVFWAVDVDWKNYGGFSGYNEAQYMVDFYLQRGRQSYIQLSSTGTVTGFGKIMVGNCRLVLDNTTGRFDPYNASGPLYGYITPGKFIKIRVQYNGTIYPVFFGKIKDIQPATTSEGSRQAIITCEDGMRFLQSNKVQTVVYPSITKDQAIQNVLTAVKWPSVWGTNLEVSSDTLPYYWANGLASDEVYNISSSDLGQFFVAADGKAKFYSRHHTAPASLTITSTQISKEVAIPQPWEVIRNNLSVTAHPLTSETVGVLWKMGDVPLIKAGTYLNSGNGVTASYSYSNSSVSATALITPVATTDYTVNTAADGSGTDLTASCSVTLTDKGTGGLLTVRNNSGSDGYITLLQVRGNALYSPNSSNVTINSTSSQDTYGTLTLSMDLPWLQDTNFIGNVATFLNSFLPVPQKFITIQFQGQPGYQYTPDLFSVINITIAALNISATNMNVGYIEHQWNSENGQDVTTTLFLEPFKSVTGYWTFDINTGNVQMGVGTIFGF